MIKSTQKYICKNCGYHSNNLSHYKRHCETIKHKNVSNDDIYNDTMMTFVTQKHFKCICGKIYKYRQGLSYHKKKCKYSQNNITTLENEIIKLKNQLIDKTKMENAHLKEQLAKKDEQIKELIPKVGNKSVTLNINNFLNDKCKNAMSLNEFINTIAISVENLLLTSKQGVSAGITNIIMENMNKLALHERPIHCSDRKREVLYIKNDRWVKDEDKKNTKEMIDKVYSKQVKSMHKMKNSEEIEFDVFVGKCVSDVNDRKVVKDLCDGVYVNNELPLNLNNTIE